MSVEQIQALAEGLATRLGRAVLVDDHDLRLVAASEDFGDQAEIALSTTGLSTTGGSGAACWSELSADALLAQFPRQSWADALLPDSVTRLLTDPAAAALLPTLDTYLNCACDVRRTATELRIHRATLYYRLNRIEQICGLSLRDGRDRLLAHLALWLHRLYGPPPGKMLGFPTVGRFGAW